MPPRSLGACNSAGAMPRAGRSFRFGCRFGPKPRRRTDRDRRIKSPCSCALSTRARACKNERTWSRPFSYDQLRELCCQQIIRPMMRIRHPESAFFNMPPTILLTQRHLIRNLNHVRSFGVNVPGKTIIIVILEIRFRLDSERQSFSLEVEANRTFYFPQKEDPILG